ncbi:hypothetical protein EVJ58_g4714 [Rhodofomes roseus]|uniref:LysM domain-containing protein n=1 Tax=Rhodofomes roseus TaxID=34475 RepID=A0A4Y9YHC4_9APHY|nr:hypothetical protein EVJ58_g4714 [Rhodofomes roseus]
MLVLRAVAVATGVTADWLSSFKHRLSSISDAHDALFHDLLLGQLRSVRASATPSSATPASTLSAASSLHLGILDTTPDNATSTYADNSTTSFVLYTSDSLPTSPGPPSACATALTATIECNSTVPLMSSYDYLFQDTADLEAVCTSACTTALTGYRSAVAINCAGYVFTDSANTTYPSTYVIDTVLGAYELQCLYDSSDAQYCGPVVNEYNATGGLLSLPTDELCTFCTLETLNITVSNPTTFSYPLQDLLSEAVEQCGSGYDSYNVTMVPSGAASTAPTATFGITGPPPMSATCVYTGQNVTITANTTCAALSAQYQVSTNDIRSNNPGLIDGTCAIAAPATLCIPPTCTLYTVQTNDTCDSVAAESGSLTGTNITTVQLISINPELGTYCQSMPALVGDTICMSPNGGWPAVGVTVRDRGLIASECTETR